MFDGVKTSLSALMSPGQRRRLRRIARPAWLGTLRRTTPLSRHWGFDRGTPVDRHYIHRFLADNRADIRGRVLEVKDSGYARRFGSDVTEVDVLDIDASNPRASIIADLSRADEIPANAYDCFILSQTLQLIPDVHGAIANAWRILADGGVLLLTVPVITKLASGMGEYDYWRFTARGCSSLLVPKFGAGNVTVCSYGSVLSAIAFLSGMAAEELSTRELEFGDDDYTILVGVRAVKRSVVERS